MFVWHKRASAAWLAANEEPLQAVAGRNLCIIYRPAQETAVVEVAHKSPRLVHRLRGRFGGRIDPLPVDWLEKFGRASATPPLRIGRRLTILTGKRGINTSGSTLVIPAGAAFGTGHHVTTAMSLRLLEQISRTWQPGWSILDCGTGTGILALAAKLFGAGAAVGIDLDRNAVSIARRNARLNRIRGVDFQRGDVRQMSGRGSFDVVVANLFARLLIEITPHIAAKLKPHGLAFLSGILRDQERDLIQALGNANFAVRIVRRRGKWVVLLVQKPS